MINIQHFITLIKQFEGIIGALLGVMATMTTTQLLKNFGKLHIYTLNSTVEYIMTGGGIYNEPIDADKHQATKIRLTYVFEIFNNAEVPKVLRDIKVCFYKGNEKMFSSIPEDNATRRNSGHGVARDDLLNINVPPKQIICVDAYSYLYGPEVELIRQCDNIQLEMRNHKGKILKQLIKDI